MSEITPLVCTACGGQLKPTTEQDRFACSNCGTEYLVSRNASPVPVSAHSQPVDTSAPSTAAKRSAPDVLLKLLDRVPDAKKLDILLEAPNLLKLVLIYGWTEQDVKQQLEAGKIPGELLLELLEREPNPDVLLARLGQPAMPSEHSKASNQSDNPGLPSRLAGVFFVVIGLMLGVVSIFSLLFFSGDLSVIQLTLLCSAPVLIGLGLWQIISGKKVIRR